MFSNFGSSSGPAPVPLSNFFGSMGVTQTNPIAPSTSQMPSLGGLGLSTGLSTQPNVTSSMPPSLGSYSLQSMSLQPQNNQMPSLGGGMSGLGAVGITPNPLLSSSSSGQLGQMGMSNRDQAMQSWNQTQSMPSSLQQVAAPGTLLYSIQQIEQQCQNLRSVSSPYEKDAIRNNVTNLFQNLVSQIRNLMSAGVENAQRDPNFMQQKMQVMNMPPEMMNQRYGELEQQFFNSPMKPQFEQLIYMFQQMLMLAEGINRPQQGFNGMNQYPGMVPMNGMGMNSGYGNSGYNSYGSGSSGSRVQFGGSSYGSSSSMGGNAIGSYSRGNNHSDSNNRMGLSRY